MVYRENVVTEPHLVIVAFGNHVVAMDVATGKRVWTHDFFIEVRSAPHVVIDEPSVYALGSELVRLDFLTGAEVWRTEVPKGCLGGTLLLVGHALIIGGQGTAACVDAKTGTVRWRDGFGGMGGHDVSLAIPGQMMRG